MIGTLEDLTGGRLNQTSGGSIVGFGFELKLAIFEAFHYLVFFT